jgi:hypothetical protein
MSGTCATLVLKKDKTITEEELKKGLEANGIKLGSFEKKTRAKAKAAYTIATSGMT